jgi:hypothetical protein
MIAAGGPGLQEAERVALGLLHRLEAVLELVGGLAEHDGATDLGVEAGPLISMSSDIALAQRAALHGARHERRAHAHRRGAAQEDALLAAEAQPLLLGQGGHVDIAHPRPDALQHRREDLVLQGGAALDQRNLLGTLDASMRSMASVASTKVAPRQARLDPGDEGVGEGALRDVADRAIAAALERGERSSSRPVIAAGLARSSARFGRMPPGVAARTGAGRASTPAGRDWCRRRTVGSPSEEVLWRMGRDTPLGMH